MEWSGKGAAGPAAGSGETAPRRAGRGLLLTTPALLQLGHLFPPPDERVTVSGQRGPPPPATAQWRKPS